MRCLWTGVALTIGCGMLAAMPGRAQRTVAEQYLSANVNQERAAAGLPSLAWNGPLASVAHQHAERMAAANVMSHQLNGEPDLNERAEQAGTHFPVLAENVGVGPSPVELHRALMQSPHHRENILDPKVNSMGVAVIFARGSLWVVEDFAMDLPKVALDDQEHRVAELVVASGLQYVAATPEARKMCSMASGFVGTQPAFVMRYTADSLDRLPDELFARLSLGGVSKAAIGACTVPESGLYNIAVVLYR